MISGKENLFELLDKEDDLIAMVAPSFVVDFDFPEIVWGLRRIGFSKVSEITNGARITNEQILSIILEDKSKTWISSTCPGVVNFVKKNYPHLEENLLKAKSPMVNEGMFLKSKFKDSKIVFFSPCPLKKFEGLETKSIDLAFTFKDLNEIFEEKGVKFPPKSELVNEKFDLFSDDETKIYPISGGLRETLISMSGGKLKKEDFIVVDGILNIKSILDEFDGEKYKNYLLVDILFCEGGCINGPMIVQKKTSIEDRKSKVLEFRKRFKGTD